MNLPPCVGKSAPGRLQKSGVSVVKEQVYLISAIASFFSPPMRKAAPPAPAEYSSASPGRPCEVSVPIAIPYLIIPDEHIPMTHCIPTVPALQANSRSAAVRFGVAWIASATMLAAGFTA
ncbi:Uncharacterised protein [uncultured archaeon]|nr:Uncharacterised protein [uncultured archaeon]